LSSFADIATGVAFLQELWGIVVAIVQVLVLDEARSNQRGVSLWFAWS
jgi:hypothetical protein